MSAVPVTVALCLPHIACGQTPPCSLLTQDQLTNALGASVGAASPIATSGCSWTSPGPPKVVLSLSLQNEKMFTAVKSSNPPKTTKTSVSGIGDEAVFTGVENFSSLWVRKGAKYLLVRIYGLPVGDGETKLKSAATSAVSKL
jgi:hypothetical protein